MKTLRTSFNAKSVHAAREDGRSAICNPSRTAYTWTEGGKAYELTYEVAGSRLRRSGHPDRVTCGACIRATA